MLCVCVLQKIYYKHDHDVTDDNEIQSWWTEIKCVETPSPLPKFPHAEVSDILATSSVSPAPLKLCHFVSDNQVLTRLTKSRV